MRPWNRLTRHILDWQFVVNPAAREPSSAGEAFVKNFLRPTFEFALYMWCRISAWLTLGLTILIVAMLASISIGFFREADPAFGWSWLGQLLAGSLAIAGGALVIAVPVGIATAIFIREFLARPTRTRIANTLVVVNALPPVLLGFVAAAFVLPMANRWIDTTAAAYATVVLVVAALTLPAVVIRVYRALESVPRITRESAVALGGTRMDVALGVTVPAALPGILSATLLAFVHALGDSVVITLVRAQSEDGGERLQTMAGHILEIAETGVVRESIEFHSIFLVGFLLFAATFLLSSYAQRLKSSADSKQRQMVIR